MLAWLLALVTVARASEPPPPITTTAKEDAQLLRGDTVIRDLGEGEIIGIVNLKTTPRKALEELLNLEPRVEEVAPIQGISYVERTPERIVAHWQVGMLGINTDFHVWYETDWEKGYTRFAIDKTRPHNVDYSSGSYHVYAHESGSRLVYRNDLDPKSRLPDWAREMLTKESMRQQIAGIKARAEQP